MKSMQAILLSGAAAASLTFITNAALAQSVRPDFLTGDVISFGDSLSDNGNIFAITGSANAFPGSNRFVNPGGLNFVEQLLGGIPDPSGANAVSPQNSPVQGTGVLGDVSIAFGGAFAGSGGLAAGVPGVTEQIGIFTGAGGTIGVEDTVTYWAGANNFFAGLPTVTNAAGAATLGQSVGALAVNDITQIGTGAVIPGGGPGQLIYVNLPNLALLPATNAGALTAGQNAAAAVLGNGGTAQQAQAAAEQTGAAVLGGAAIATGAYNQTLAGGVRQLAAADTNTTYVLLDAASVFDQIVANPAAFGFTNVTDGCVLVASCASASFEEQNQFLFSDGVHPTNAGYGLLAELARQTLDPASSGTAASGIADAPLSNRQFVSAQALARARSFFFQDQPEGLSSTADLEVLSDNPVATKRGAGFIEALAGTSTIGARATTPEVQSDLYGFRLGADLHQSDTTIFGFQASFTTGQGSQPQVEFEPNSFAIDLYGAKKFGNAFIALNAGAARLDVSNIERSVGVGGLVNRSDTQGQQFNVIGEVGYDYKIAGLTIIPSASLGYYRTALDGYEEQGTFAPLAFGERRINAITGAVNLRAAKNIISQNGFNGQVFAGIGYEDYLLYDANDLSVSALASSAAASSVAIDDADGRGFLFDIGGQFDIDATFSIAADYTLGIGGSDTQSHQGSLRLISRF